MSISFNQVPSNMRVPFLYAEFDSSKAQKGSAIKSYSAMLFGQKLAGGSATADVPVLVTSVAQAISLFGRGSFLHNMVQAFLANNKFTELTVLPQADNGAGVTATGSVQFAGPATAAGTIEAYIAGQKVECAVSNGDSANTIATNFQAALALALDLPVTSAVDGITLSKVNLTCRHKGLLGNEIDIRFNYQTGEAFPAGVSVTITPMSGGTTAPALTNSIANMTEKQFDIIGFPYNDAASLTAIETELDSRWAPIRQNDGHVITAKSDTVANLGTFGVSRNSKHVTCFGLYKFPTPCYEVAAAAAAVAAYYLQQDPARPLQTLELAGVLAPAAVDEFDISERNILLHDGIATVKMASDRRVLIERAITMYQLNGAGAADVSYLDINTLMTLSYLRYDFRNYMLTKYPRHKLGNDGTRYGAGQAVITPMVGKAEAISRFRAWEELGLVEGADQFKRDLIVERNSGDVNRLDFMLPTDLMNQLMVLGCQIGFIL
jgi:phage tail sheath gpL-like